VTTDLAALTAVFGRMLHAAGLPVSSERSGRLARAISCAAPATIEEIYWLGRVTLVADHAHISVFDRVFRQVFEGLVDVADGRGDANEPAPPNTRAGAERRSGDGARPVAPAPSPSERAGTGESEQGDGEGATVVVGASSDDRLRAKDFADWTDDELASLRTLIANLRVAPPLRASRRYVARRRGDRLDLRATLRRSHRTGGDPVEQMWRRRKPRRRRLVLIADISGSMEPYARAYVHLLHGAVRATNAEAFVFATRLTRLTRDLAIRNPDLAMQRAASAAPDWSGGTRIGAALAAFNDDFGRRGTARGAIVVIVSDGWERDDPALLGEQMARLARLAHRIVWVNPRSASERYEPLVGGMAVALPHVDRMVSGHSLVAMSELIEAIGTP
jgi:hypothetical protein